MRKIVIALMIVLPLVFVLVLFSSANLVSISVPVSVQGISIYADGDPLPDGEALYVDMADGKDHTVKAQVVPANAFEKGYTLESDNTDVLDISSDGVISAFGEGSANVKATSKDKGFTASVPVVVTSSKAYDVAFSMYDSEGNAVKLRYNESTSAYTASELKAGSYTYKVDVFGGDSSEYSLSTENDPNGIRAILSEGEQKVMLPFSGSTTLKLEVEDALVNGMLNQTIRRTVNLDVEKTKSESGIVVNGVPDGNTVLLAKGSTKAFVYVECEGEPELMGDGITDVRCTVHGTKVRSASDNWHKLEVTIAKSGVDEIMATLTSSEGSVPLKFSFADFDFDLRSTVMNLNNDMYDTVILKDTATTVYAVPAVDLHDVEYEWSSSSDILTLKTSSNGSSCSFKAAEDGEYKVTVSAKRNGKVLGKEKQLNVKVTTKVTSIWINNSTDVDLAERYTVGGQKFAADGSVTDNTDYAIKITVSKKGLGPQSGDFTDIEFETSDRGIASVSMRGGMAYLDINGTGAVTVTVSWKYNKEFGSGATQSISLNVVKDAVEVANYTQLRRMTEEGRKVVLISDIMLGTDDSGEPLPIDERKAIASRHKYKSTYNVAWYSAKNNLESAQVMYALEFKNDVYGNGFDIDADYFTNALDAAGQPQIFKGPLSFVGFGETYSAARVAAQDNCAFLIRTDGVKLYGVNLLGCSDESLLDDNGNYELNHLNYVGTTLDINADCDIINCRIRNGRNVVRVYGGNRNATHSPMSYYVSSIPQTDVSDEDRAIVNIKGCILTQSREFIVKVGANKAIKASKGNPQPELKNENGVAYKETTKKIPSVDENGNVIKENGNVKMKTVGINQYEGTDSEFFYNRYVMTDITLEDSVLETSGLFSVGVESNFGGEVLCEGSASRYASMLQREGWANSGATSFASMVRLVGDVRLYDWKDVAHVDSSTLIESGNGSSALEGILSFNISAMLQEVDGQSDYAKLLYKTDDGKTFVHGGIAYYGGGRNYSLIDLSRFKSELNNLNHININIEQFATSSNPITSKQTRLLPLASGTHDFNFWLYTADGSNSYSKQQSDISEGVKYRGVTKVKLFDDVPAE